MARDTTRETFAWADWSTRYCLPRLLDQLGEPALAHAARNLSPVVDGDAADGAFLLQRDISDRVCERFGAGTDVAAAMVVSALTLAEINEIGGRDVGWLVSRARYDASRLAAYAVAFGVADDNVARIASDDLQTPPIL